MNLFSPLQTSVFSVKSANICLNLIECNTLLLDPCATSINIDIYIYIFFCLESASLFYLFIIIIRVFLFLFSFCTAILCLLFFCVSCDSVVWKDPGPEVPHLLKASCLESEVIWWSDVVCSLTQNIWMGASCTVHLLYHPLRMGVSVYMYWLCFH